MAQEATYLEDNPEWYRDAVIYQLHIKAFYDLDGNGIGDIHGLTEKLDYLHELGVTVVWLLPFYPSPLKDDGYDIADYYRVNPAYNDLRAFRQFLKAAHRLGIRVVTELVMNHTSDQHPWFQRARRSRPGSSHRNYYVWSDTPEKYQDARIIFQDFETSNWSWDPIAKAYYWHRFYAHQPDLNFDNPQVQREMLRVIDFWFGLGVDGVRLDAVPYLYEREGTNCENLPETHAFLKRLRAHVDARFRNRMLLSEANQWPEDAVAYFGTGDESHMAFHFPVMPRMFMAVQMEDRFPIVDILDQTPAIPEGCQWAMFLRNHDELTLEMVTDEERDYMYRVYASDPRARINLGIRRRLAPLMGNNRRRIELMNFLLFSLPGTPIIYYGDEIGMGDNYYLGDRDGVRTPMQWSPDRNAGFSKVNPQRLYLPVIIEPEYHYETVNVENQQRNSSSLLWWMRRVIAMRKRFKAFGRGSLEMLYPDNPKVLAFVRRFEEETILVVVNLSRYSQVTHLELRRFAGMIPEEVFSRNIYPAIRESPYLLTLGIHDHLWFALRPERRESCLLPSERPLLKLKSGANWTDLFKGRTGALFYEQVLPGYLARCRWFRSKTKAIRELLEEERIPLATATGECQLVLVRACYTEDGPELYALPMAFVPAEEGRRLVEKHPQGQIASVQVGDQAGMIVDAMFLEGFRNRLLSLIAGSRRAKGLHGELVASAGKGFRARRGELPAGQLLRGEQTNSAILYGDRYFFKLYRGLEEGINPDPEITRFLTERTDFPQAPPFAGAIEYRRWDQEPICIGLLQGYVASHGDAWRFTLDALHATFEQVLSRREEVKKTAISLPPLFGASPKDLPPIVMEVVGTFYVEMAGILGRRTAEMHLALASDPLDPVWRPEEFSTLYQRSVYQSMRNLVRRTLITLDRSLANLAPEDRPPAERVLAAEKEILVRLSKIMGRKITSRKIRIHGDYHLGQVLFTGKDFVIIDFEGEPARTLSERRLKRSPLRDVAGMVRSFHYAAMTALRTSGQARPEDLAILEPWGRLWHALMAGEFLRSYRQRLAGSRLVPARDEEFSFLLHAFLLEKAVYELGYELNNRPDWICLPLAGIEMILAAPDLT